MIISLQVDFNKQQPLRSLDKEQMFKLAPNDTFWFHVIETKPETIKAIQQGKVFSFPSEHVVWTHEPQPVLPLRVSRG
jgi:hypothetical protein